MANKKYTNKLYIGNRLTIDSNVEPEGLGQKDEWLANKRDLEYSLNYENVLCNRAEKILDKEVNGLKEIFNEETNDPIYKKIEEFMHKDLSNYLQKKNAMKEEIEKEISDKVLKIEEVSEKPLCVEIKNRIREDLSEYYIEVSRAISTVKSNLSNFEINRVINNLYLIGIQEFWGNILLECTKKYGGSIDLVNDKYDKKLLRTTMPKIKVGRTSFSESEESFKECFDKKMKAFVRNEICLPIEIINDKKYKKVMQRYNSAFKSIFSSKDNEIAYKKSIDQVEGDKKAYKKSPYFVLNKVKLDLNTEIVFDEKIEKLRNVYYGFSFVNKNILEKWESFLNDAKRNEKFYKNIRNALDGHVDKRNESTIDDVVFAFIRCSYLLMDIERAKGGTKVKEALKFAEPNNIDRSSALKINDIRELFMDALSFYLFSNYNSFFDDDFEKSKSELSMAIQENRVFRFLFELVKWCDSNFEDGDVIEEYCKEAKEDFDKRCAELGLGTNAIESMIGKQYFLSTFGFFGMSKRKCSDFFYLYDVPIREEDREENNHDVKVGEYATKVKEIMYSGYWSDKKELDVLHNNRMLFGRLLSYGHIADKLMDIHKYDSIDYSAGRYLKSIKGVAQNENRLPSSIFKTSSTMSLYDKKKNSLYSSMLHNYCDILEILEDEIDEGDAANVEKYSNLYYEKNGEFYFKIDEFMLRARKEKRSVIERYEEADNKLAESFFYLDWDCNKILEILLKILRRNSK